MSFDLVYNLEILAALISLICICVVRSKFLIAITLLEVITVLVEQTGGYFSQKNHINQALKIEMYNIFSVFEYVSYLLCIRYLLNDKKSKIYQWIIPTITSFSLINFLFIQGFKIYHTYSGILFSLMLICICLYKLYTLSTFQLSKLESNIVTLFFIAIIFFYTMNFTNKALLNALLKNHQLMATKLYSIINGGSNILLYSAISVVIIMHTFITHKSQQPPKQPI